MTRVRTVYASKMSEWVGEKDIQDILQVSRKNNQHNGLTGMLCFGSRQFLQCLEGDRESVNRTYNDIVRDPRHHSVVLISYEEVENREFADWLMAYVPESSLTAEVLTRAMGRREFSPFQLNAQTAAAFVVDIKSSIPAI